MTIFVLYIRLPDPSALRLFDVRSVGRPASAASLRSRVRRRMNLFTLLSQHHRLGAPRQSVGPKRASRRCRPPANCSRQSETVHAAATASTIPLDDWPRQPSAIVLRSRDGRRQYLAAGSPTAGGHKLLTATALGSIECIVQFSKPAATSTGR